MSKRAFVGASVFDGRSLQAGKALLLEDGNYQGCVAPQLIPHGFKVETMEGGTLMPGFVDLQVNGGGGVMFNDETSVDGLRTIAQAHAATGTRTLLPTLITDTPEKSLKAVDAVEAAIAEGVSGIVGIHLEGPHLSIARKGAHDSSLIRRMTDDDESFLQDAGQRLPNVMVTVAPENVTLDQIARLSRSGIIVSLGHTDCTFDEAEAAFAAGARCVTHLFNAMSQMGNREPGLVGAALNAPNVSAGLIADNIHVHAGAMRVAIASKSVTGAIFLVTDAMSTVGSDITEFSLNGRRVFRHEGRLTLEDGTLAGADLDLPTAISLLIGNIGVEPALAYAMATSFPASVLKDAVGFGELLVGRPWNGIYLDSSLQYSPNTTR